MRYINFNSDGNILVSHDGSDIILWNLNLDNLLVRGCEWLYGYLKTNPNVSDEDNTVCDDVLNVQRTTLQQQIDAKPNHPTAWELLGTMAEAQGRLEEAITAFRKQSEVNPDHAAVWRKLGFALLVQGNRPEAATALQHYLVLTQKDLDIYEALFAYHTIRRIAPDYSWTPEQEQNWGMMADALMNTDEATDAIAALQILSEINPDRVETWSNLGLTFKELEEAVTTYQNLQNSAYINAWDGLGSIFEKQGRLDAAVTAYQKQVEVKPNHENAWNSLGVIFFNQLGRFAEAEAAFQKQVEIKPDLATAWSNLALALKKQGKFEEAVAAYQKLVELKPDHADAWNSLGVILFNQLSKFEDAIAAFQKQVEAKPDHALAWRNLGFTSYIQGYFIEAEAAFNKALALEPTNLFVLSKDAELALVQGDNSRCQTRVEKALSLVTTKDQEYAILSFFSWLANPQSGWEKVMAAIKELEPDVKFSWHWSNVMPVIERQDEATQQIARHFIAFFEGKIDLPTLKSLLAKFSK